MCPIENWVLILFWGGGWRPMNLWGEVDRDLAVISISPKTDMKVPVLLWHKQVLVSRYWMVWGWGQFSCPRHPPPCCSLNYDICINSLGSSFSWLTETISKFKTQENRICASKQHLPNDQVGNSASLLDYYFHQGWVFLPSAVFSQCLENVVSAGWHLRCGRAATSLSTEQFCFVSCSYGCSISSQQLPVAKCLETWPIKGTV